MGISEQTLAQIREALLADEALQRAIGGEPAALAGRIDDIDPANSGATAWSDWLAHASQAATLPPSWHRAEAPPRQWLPVQVYDVGEGLRVEWLHFGFAALTDPFFEQSIARARALPLNLLLRCSTPVDALLPFAAKPQPDGLVFHISRCGSTLVGQMLSVLDDVTVVAEPPPLDSALRLWLEGVLPPQIVQGMAGALTRDRSGTARRRIIKLDAWHSLVLPRIAGLFPAARSLFLFRDPLEVIVSQARRPGLHARRGEVPLASFGLSGEDGVRDADFISWVIAAVARAGLAAAGRPGLRFLDYAALPAAFTEAVLPHFGIAASADEQVRLGQAGARYSKDPSRSFTSDAADKQDAADANLRSRADAHGLGVIYQNLKRAAAGARYPATPSVFARPPQTVAQVSIRFD